MGAVYLNTSESQHRGLIRRVFREARKEELWRAGSKRSCPQAAGSLLTRRSPAQQPSSRCCASCNKQDLRKVRRSFAAYAKLLRSRRATTSVCRRPVRQQDTSAPGEAQGRCSCTEGHTGSPVTTDVMHLQKPHKLRHMLADYGELGRLYLAPEGAAVP